MASNEDHSEEIKKILEDSLKKEDSELESIDFLIPEGGQKKVLYDLISCITIYQSHQKKANTYI